MPVAPRPLPATLGNAFSTAAALDEGVSSGRLRAKDLERPFHGARQKPEAATPEPAQPPSKYELARRAETRKARAYVPVIGPNAFFAGLTAAILQGASLDPGGDLTIAVTSPHRAPRRRGIHGIKVSPHLVELHEHDGMRMSTPTSTWAMLGAQLSVRQLVALGDSIVRIPRDEHGVLLPGAELGTVDQLERWVEAGRRVGIAKLRRALPLIRVGSASPLETDFRLDAAAGGLPEPDLDVEIRDSSGRLLGISEFAFPKQRTVVEIEGDHHRTDRRQWNRDIDKYASYAAEGWDVVRLTSAHIRGERPRAVGIVRAALLRRGGRAAVG